MLLENDFISIKNFIHNKCIVLKNNELVFIGLLFGIKTNKSHVLSNINR